MLTQASKKKLLQSRARVTQWIKKKKKVSTITIDPDKKFYFSFFLFENATAMILWIHRSNSDIFFFCLSILGHCFHTIVQSFYLILIILLTNCACSIKSGIKTFFKRPIPDSEKTEKGNSLLKLTLCSALALVIQKSNSKVQFCAYYYNLMKTENCWRDFSKL